MARAELLHVAYSTCGLPRLAAPARGACNGFFTSHPRTTRRQRAHDTPPHRQHRLTPSLHLEVLLLWTYTQTHKSGSEMGTAFKRMLARASGQGLGVLMFALFHSSDTIHSHLGAFHGGGLYPWRQQLQGAAAAVGCRSSAGVAAALRGSRLIANGIRWWRHKSYYYLRLPKKAT
jgi:hypothetical protein